MLRYLGRASIWQLTSHTRTHITYISILKPEQNGRDFAEMLMVSIADQRNRVLHDKFWLNVHVINHIGIHLNYLFSHPAMFLHFVLFSIHCLGLYKVALPGAKMHRELGKRNKWNMHLTPVLCTGFIRELLSACTSSDMININKQCKALGKLLLWACIFVDGTQGIRPLDNSSLLYWNGDALNNDPGTCSGSLIENSSVVH